MSNTTNDVRYGRMRARRDNWLLFGITVLVAVIILVVLYFAGALHKGSD